MKNPSDKKLSATRLARLFHLLKLPHIELKDRIALVLSVLALFVSTAALVEAMREKSSATLRCLNVFAYEISGFKEGIIDAEAVVSNTGDNDFLVDDIGFKLGKYYDLISEYDTELPFVLKPGEVKIISLTARKPDIIRYFNSDLFSGSRGEISVRISGFIGSSAIDTNTPPVLKYNKQSGEWEHIIGSMTSVAVEMP